MSELTVIQGTGATAQKAERPNPADTPNWLTTEEFAKLCGISGQAVRKGIAEKRYKKTKEWINSKGNLAYKVHYSDLPAAALRPIMEAKMAQEQRKISMQPDEYDAETAWQKWQAVKEYFTDGTESTRLAEMKKLPARTLQRWIAEWRKAEDGRKMAALAKKPRKDRGAQRLMTEDIEQAAAALWLRQCRPRMAQVYKQMQEIDELAPTLPSMKTVQRYLNNLPPRIKTLAREGEKKYHDNFDKIILRDLNTYQVREVYVGDHHQFDCFVEYRGRLIRPWVTCWMDFRTRCITGWTIGERPSGDSIATSLRNALIGNESPFFGIPERLLIDNGKDYRGKRLNGEAISFGKIDFKVGAKTVLGELGIKVQLATPYNARTKPIERWFRTLEDQYIRGIPGYCGNKPANRPERLQKDIDAFYRGRKGYFYTMEDIREDFKAYLSIYHDEKHAGLHGDTPAQIWDDHAAAPRTPANQTLSFLLMKHEKKVVANGGIRIFGTGTQRRYFWHPALADMVGTKVDVRYDPQDITKIYIFHDIKFICIAECRELLGADAKEEDVSAAIKEQRSITKHDKALLDSIMAGWKEPDPILRQAAKRGGEKQEKIRKTMAASAVIHAVPEYEGNMDRKSLRNAEGLKQDSITEYLRPVASIQREEPAEPSISEEYFKLLEGDMKDE